MYMFTAFARSASYHVAKISQPDCSALLKPSGSFQQLNAQKQSKNNAFMAGGSLFGIASGVAVYLMGFIDFVDPPKIPK